ncbi:hypothetical protein ACJJTC_016035 [Scirpophaga incertulas]
MVGHANHWNCPNSGGVRHTGTFSSPNTDDIVFTKTVQVYFQMVGHANHWNCPNSGGVRHTGTFSSPNTYDTVFTKTVQVYFQMVGHANHWNCPNSGGVRHTGTFTLPNTYDTVFTKTCPVKKEKILLNREKAQNKTYSAVVDEKSYPPLKQNPVDMLASLLKSDLILNMVVESMVKLITMTKNNETVISTQSIKDTLLETIKNKTQNT